MLIVSANKNEAYYTAVPMIDVANPEDFLTGETVSAEGYYQDGVGAWTALTESTSLTIAELGTTGMYSVFLAAGDMNHDRLIFKLSSTNASDSAIMFDTTGVPVREIADGAIVAATLGADCITEAKIADDAIAAEHIASAAIVAATFGAGAIDAAAIGTGAIDADALEANAITATKIASGAITAAKLAANCVTNATIATDAIQASKIEANAITAAKIASSAITSAKIATIAINNTHFATSAIQAGAIATDAITAAKIATDAITAAKIATDAITADKIAANAIGASEIADGAIDAATFAAGAINAASIATSAITADKIGTQAIQNAKFEADAITADKIASDVSDEIRDKVKNIVRGAAAQAGGTRTITLDASASSTDDAYNGKIIMITESGKEQMRLIVDYDQATKIATVDRDWDASAQPASTDTFIIYDPEGFLTLPRYGKVTVTNTDQQFETDLTGEGDDEFNGSIMLFVSGANVNAVARIINDYTDVDGEMLLNRAWPNTVAENDQFLVMPGF